MNSPHSPRSVFSIIKENSNKVAPSQQKRCLLLLCGVFSLLFLIIPATAYIRSEAASSTIAAQQKSAQGVSQAKLSGAKLGGVRQRHIKLSAGREVTAATEDSQELQILRQGGAHATALASADFDEDGVPDLVSGYANGAGGALILRRGNVDSIYPNSPEAQARKKSGGFSHAPFLMAANVISTETVPELIGAGDFDGDSHWDIVTARRGGESLYLFSGDGAGNFVEAKKIELPGELTTLLAGEVNQADGLTDLMVGIETAGQAQLLVFEGPEGALKSEPEVITLPAAASSLALGQLDDASAFDLAVAAGSEVVLIHGRDRRLSYKAEERTTVKQAAIERRQFSSAIRSVAIGNFKSEHRDGIALLTEDGVVHLLSPQRTVETERGAAGAFAAWEHDPLATGQWPQASRLLGVKVSSYGGDDLMLLDSGTHQIHLLAGDKLHATPKSQAPPLATDVENSSQAESKGGLASLDAAGDPVAVLPMLLDTDALFDLVVITNEEFDPSVTLTAQEDNSDDDQLTQVRRGAGELPQWLDDFSLKAGVKREGKSSLQRMSKQVGGSGASTQAGAGKAVSPVASQQAACTSTDINLGQTVNGALTTTDCQFTTGEYFDAYTFYGIVGQRVAITLNSNSFDTYLYLLAPGGSVLAIDDDSGGLGNSRIPGGGDFITLPTTGSYTIYATSFQPVTLGQYQLGITLGTNPCAPAPINFGAFSGSLADGDCRFPNGAYGDWYAINVAAGTQVSLTMSSTDFDAVLHIYAPNGELYASDDPQATRDAIIPVGGNFLTLGPAGTYFILATSFSARVSGSYQLSVFNNPSGCPYSPILYGQSVTGTLSTLDPCGVNFTDGVHRADAYTFVGRAGDRIAADMLSNDIDSYLVLYAPGGTIYEDDDSGFNLDAHILSGGGFLTLPYTGVYVIQATSAILNDTGSYVFSLSVQSSPTVVTNTLDSGTGSLRQAILNANANPGADTISFNIGTGAKTITPASPLPSLVGAVTIDGTTQPGYAGSPLIEINGINAGSQGVGIKLLGGNSRVRGLVINRFGIACIAVTALGNNVIFGGNIIEGNYIGTDITGQFARPYPQALAGDQRESQGIIIDSSQNNTIGGTTAAARNIISGNRDVGVVVERSFRLFSISGNRIIGNYVGLNVGGNAGLGNGSNGVVILTGANNSIGGTVAGARNVISANGAPGVALGGTSLTDGNLVQGNYIGTNAAGNAALGNVGGMLIGGVLLRDQPYLQSIVLAVNNLIGGTTAAARNIVSGNRGGNGIDVINTGTTDNRVQGNFIGTDASGTAPLGNAGSGLFVTFAAGNLVGGDVAGAGNVIASNGEYGIGVGLPRVNPLTGQVIAGIKGVEIIGNYIGTNSSGTTRLGNRWDGVLIAAQSVDNLLRNNRIAFNGGNGVYIPNVTPNSSGNPGLKNTLDSNLIYGNAQLGIDLHEAGITPNDPGDTDDGANLRQNFPDQLRVRSVVSSATEVDGELRPLQTTITVGGKLSSKPNTNYLVHSYFYPNSQCTGNQAGVEPFPNSKFFVQTGADGTKDFTIDLTFPGNVTAGVINTTATAQDGPDVKNTSEFSPCLVVSTTDCPIPGAISPASGAVGSNINISGANLSRVNAVKFSGGVAGTIVANTGTQLTVTVPPGAVSGPITLSSATCADVLTTAYTVAASNPAPSITSLTPASANAGGVAFTLTVNGSNFVNGAKVRWNGTDRTTTFVNGGQLTASIPAADIVAAGNKTVTAFNPAPGGGTSNGLNFSVTQTSCAYALSQASQNFPSAGGAGSFTLTTGAGCPWTVASAVPWLVINGGGGSGSGAVNFTVAANAGTGRVGKITAGGQSFTLMQAAAPGCEATVYPALQPFGAATGGGRVTVIVNPQCGWNVVNDTGWASITAGASGAGTARVRYNAASNTGSATRTGTIFIAGRPHLVTQTSATTTPSVQFSAATYPINEGTTANAAVITVTRQGDTSGGSTVEYATVDDPAPVPCNPANTAERGKAYARCDYATSIDTLTFAPGEASKTFAIPLINDSHLEGAETFRIVLQDPRGASLGTQAAATVTINDDDTNANAPNSIFVSRYFVRMHYLDFLSREPEEGEPWTGVLNRCSDVENNPECDRIIVSSSFFGSPEFRLKGFFVFVYYKASFGNPANPNFVPQYDQIIADLRRVAGATENEFYAKRFDFTEDWLTRPAFVARYGAATNAQFVDSHLANVGATLTQPDPVSTVTRNSLVADLDAGRKTRAEVLQLIVESQQVNALQKNHAFVAMQYYGYLRRTPDATGYLSWLNAISPPRSEDTRNMVSGFMNAVEYRWRFGANVR